MNTQDEPEVGAERLDRIEKELDKVKSVKFVDPGVAEGDDALAELEARARQARAVHKSHTPEGTVSNYVGPEGGRSLGRGLQVAYAIIGVPIVGFLVGLAIDTVSGGMFWRGILTILGATVAVWYAIKSASRED